MLLYFLYCVRCLVFRSFLFVWLLPLVHSVAGTKLDINHALVTGL